jgi:hypothetical protein
MHTGTTRDSYWWGGGAWSGLAAPEEVARQPEHDEGADDGADQAAQSKMSVSPMPARG